MKKFMFSAIAMMAFSFNSFSATSESMVVNELDCKGIAHDTYWAWYGRGATHETATAKAEAAKSECEEENKKNTSID